MELFNVKIGKTFKIEDENKNVDIEFIKFVQNGDEVIAVAKDALFISTFGENNEFAKSNPLKKLQKDILPKIESAVGAENVLEFETDLLSFDGLDTQGKIKSKISLITLDFYRANARLFDKYKLDDWWWLATPWSTPEHYNDYWTLCVSPCGCMGYCNYNRNYGVRPILRFVSSISVSCEE